MKNIHLYTLAVLFLFSFQACSDEEELVISEKKAYRFDLPQGEHDFDDQILEWYDKYGTAVLYKFSNPDLNYQFTSNATYDVKAGAEEEGIAAAVQFLKEYFFDLYSDKVKKELFPSKILMAGMLYMNNNYVPLWDTINYGNLFFPKGVFVRGMDHITFPHVDNAFGQRIGKPAYRRSMKIALNRTFFQFLMKPYSEDLAKIDYDRILRTFSSYSLVSEESARDEVTDPNSVNNKWYNEEDMHPLGFLEYSSHWEWDFLYPIHWVAPDLDNDFYSFLGFIFSQTKKELEANPIYVNNPAIQKKCKYLVEAFAAYGIDLHCVGDRQ